MNFGYIESSFDERDLYCASSNETNFPKSYRIKPRTLVIDQRDVPKCVSVAISQMLYYYALYRQQIIPHTFSDALIWESRADTSIRGMTPREGLKLAQTITPIKIRRYARVPVGFSTMKECLLAYGPMLVTLPVYSRDARFWEGSNFEGGHACIITGYDNRGFEIKNSWGREWNDGGYTYIDIVSLDRIIELWVIIS